MCCLIQGRQGEKVLVIQMGTPTISNIIRSLLFIISNIIYLTLQQ